MVAAAYNLLLCLLAPAAVPLVAIRMRLRGRPWRRVWESLGFPPKALEQAQPGAIWVHGVSVGEVLLAVPLVRRLRERFPNRPIVVSTGTPTGQDMACEKLAAFADHVFYVPFDFPWAVRATMRAVRPGLVLILETEIWPNLYREAKCHGASVLLANGRISDKSAPSYLRLRRLFAPVLANCDAILTQSSLDAERFVAAGAPPDVVRVAGNVKYDFEPASAELPAPVSQLLERLQPSPILVAGSTREGEEALVVEAFRQVVQRHPKALLVVAPRHPQRFDEAYVTLRASGLPVLRRSALDADAAELPAVLLLDSLGELASLYACATAAFVGGSLNGWGGHNVLEPALYGRPVVVGPHMQNFRDIAERLLAAQALIQIDGAPALAPAWSALLDDPANAAAVGARGKSVAEAERGATRRVVETAAALVCEAAPVTPPGLLQRLTLGPASLLWAAGARLHAALSTSPKRLPRFTLCVGNLTAGGSGKTPAVLRLSERLTLRGLTPAILTRGYGRRSREPFLVEPFSEADPVRAGDEAAVLAERLMLAGTEAAIGVGSDRYAVGTALANTHPVDLFLLDDGFSHHALARDCNLLLVDVTRPLLEEPFLPLGRRREPFRALARANAFLLTRTTPGCAYTALIRRLRRYAPQAPVFFSRVAPQQLRSADRVARAPLEPSALAGRKVAAFCGLGNPNGFFTTLKGAGANLVSQTVFRDHHRYSADDWWLIAAAARDSGADLVVTTEKDIANLAAAVPPEMRTGAPPLYALVIELDIDDEEALLDWIERSVEEARR